MLNRATHLLAAALALAAAGRAQSPTPRKLGAPTATLGQEFTGIEGVWEMKDGRVILLDAQDKAIHLLDLKTGSDTKIGRDGDGPHEFRLPLEIWAVGDSAVVRDMARAGKLMAMSAKGDIDGFVSMLDSALSTRSFNAVAADASGRYYGLEATANGVLDSARIVRWDLRKHTRDTVARFMTSVASTITETDVIRDASGRAIGYRPGPPRAFVPYNAWTVAADGRVAIAWAAPYRITYVKLDGSRVNGPNVPYTPVPVTEAEKAAWKLERGRAVPMISFSRDGPPTAGFRKPPPTGADVVYADVLPPFVFRNGLRFASDGMLWVSREVKAGAPPLYDVFDGAAKRAYQLELPAKRKVVGFGAGVVYLARVDDDDLHYLERYKLIPTRAIAP